MSGETATTATRAVGEMLSRKKEAYRWKGGNPSQNTPSGKGVLTLSPEFHDHLKMSKGPPEILETRSSLQGLKAS